MNTLDNAVLDENEIYPNRAIFQVLTGIRPSSFMLNARRYTATSGQATNELIAIYSDHRFLLANQERTLVLKIDNSFYYLDYTDYSYAVCGDVFYEIAVFEVSEELLWRIGTAVQVSVRLTGKTGHVDAAFNLGNLDRFTDFCLNFVPRPENTPLPNLDELDELRRATTPPEEEWIDEIILG